jgi:hypothetical protein
MAPLAGASGAIVRLNAAGDLPCGRHDTRRAVFDHANIHVFDTADMDGQPVEHAPDKWRGEFEGDDIRHNGDPIPGHGPPALSGTTAPRARLSW